MYQYEVEVTTIYTDFDKSNAISNLLVEKLYDSVKVSVPEFYHSQQKLENFR